MKLYEFEEVVRIATVNRRDVVLDVGCSIGIQTLLLSRKCAHVTGIDISEEAISKANKIAAASGEYKTVSFKCCDVTATTFENRSFDKVLCLCVLEHIPDWRRSLGLLRKSIKSEGKIILSVDSLSTIKDGHLLEKHRKECSVEIYFDKNSLAVEMERAGYSNVEVYPLLRSPYARWLLERSISSGSYHNLNLIQAILEYKRLKQEERKNADCSEGIFLICRATVLPIQDSDVRNCA